MGRLAKTILTAVLMIAPVGALGDTKLESALANVNRIADSAASTKPATAPSETGEAASEVIRGNGGRAGYVLGHGDIIPGSEWVYIGLKRAKANTDYTIDYASGSLFFAEPVRQSESVRVDYRYSQKSKGDRNVTGPGMVPLKFAGGNLQTNLTYAYRAADPTKGPNAPDILTYGLNSVTSFGGSSSLQSMFYMATPQSSNRLSLSGNAAPTAAGGKDSPVKKDRLVLQNADFGLGGKTRLRIGYQQVGEGFAGMQSLRDSQAAPEDVLKQLEKEKGIKRMSMALEMPTGSSGALNVSRSTIEDKGGDIVSQMFGFSGTNFRFNYLTRDVAREFTRFKDLREADAAQMAAEAGIRRTGYAMQFRTGMDASKAPIWSGFNFIRLRSDQGELSYRTLDLETGKLKVHADMRTMDPEFTAMAALNDGERTRMAQIARRQFNPNAQASEVTADDKARMNKEAGINRKAYSFQYDGWLSFDMANRETSTGGNADTSRVGVNWKNANLSFYHHRIDESFDKLSLLQPVEIARFGNETGMNRTEAQGSFKLGFGDLGLAHGNVTDHQGASVRRQSIDFKNKRLEFRANFQDIDPEFSRIGDLSDGDKKMLAQERGFRRSDYSIKLEATRNLTFDSYIYDSSNVTADQTRYQRRYKVSYTPGKGPRISALTDNFSYISDEGNISSYSHRKITLDNQFSFFGGLLFKGMTDVNTTQEEDEDARTVRINQTHLETNQSAPTSYTFDTLTTDYGDGVRFEDSWEFGSKRRITSNLALTGAYSRTSREEDKSEKNAKFGFEWSPKKDLTIAARLANRDGGPKGSQQAKELTMKGSLAKRFLCFSDVTVDSGVNTTELKGKQVGCDNGLRINAGLIGGKFTFDNSDKLNPKNGIYYTSRVFQYESDKDPNRKYHLTFFRQNLVTPTGEPAQKRNYAFDAKVARSMNVTLTSYFGKDGKNGAVLPIGGGVFKLSRSLGANTTLFADYFTERNSETHRHARTTGLGFIGTLSNKASVELYFGWSRLIDGGLPDYDNVFRIKYDHKIDGDHSLSLSAQKRSGVDKSSINPYEGNTTARLDFRTVFD